MDLEFMKLIHIFIVSKTA